MTSSAYSDLNTRLDEVRLLTDLDPARAGDTTQATVSNVINRGCLVLLSAHLEGYLEDLVVEAIDVLGQERVLVEQLPLVLRALYAETHLRPLEPIRDRNARAPKIAKMITEEAPLWMSGNTVQIGLLRPRVVCAEMDNPGSHEIRQFLELLGVDIRVYLRNRSAESLLGRINGLVAKRNGIAHGEVSASATFTDVDEYLALVAGLCAHVDDAMAESVQGICSKATLPW